MGLGVGILFSASAVWLQKPMAEAVAFLAFEVAALIIVRLVGIGNHHPLYSVFFIIGGTIGAVLAFSFFE